ncbi:hypothetical protein ACFL2U_01505 [Patescibacteria group bacterium]
MAWYIEYDFRPFHYENAKPVRKLMELDCPNDINARQKALQEAKKQLKSFRLPKPKLVWQEQIKESKY